MSWWNAQDNAFGGIIWSVPPRHTVQYSFTITRSELTTENLHCVIVVIDSWCLILDFLCVLQEFTQDWEHMVALASTERLPAENALPFHSLEDIHIFVLAQLLRRPIIVLSEAYMRNMRGSVLAPNHAPGIYLPLLWPPELCVRSPLVLAYFMNHFSPLIPRAGDSDQYVSAVPLVSSNSESLCVHYMTDTEESQVTTKLEMYLDLIEVPAPVGDMQPPRLAARLTRENLAPNLDLIVDFEAKFEEMWHQKGACRPPPESPAVGAPATSNTGTCITPGCKFFGSKDFGGRCSCCHRDVSRVLESGKKKCSVTKCVNTIEKVEHEPYCNFHSYLKQHSASHPPPPKAHTDTLPSKQRVTDPDLLAGARGKTGLEPTGVKGTTAPEIKEQPPRAPQRRATEPLPARGELLATVSPLCRIPGCHLKAKPEFDHQCKQHYALQQAKELAENVKPILLPKCTRCNKMSGVSHFEGMCGECYTAVSLAKTKADPSKTPVPPPGPECSTKNCSEVGMEEKGGLCLDCYNRSLTLRLEASARNEKDRVGGEETEQKLPFEIETETIPDRPTASAAQAPKESATRLTENATLQAESKRPASVVTQTPCETALKPTENPPVVKRTETYAKPKEQSPTAEMMGFEMLPEKEDTQTEEAAPTEFKQDVNPATEEPSGPPVDHLAQLKLSLEGKENTPSPVNPPVDEETVKFGLGENSSSFDRSISSEACSSLIVSEGHSLPEEPKPEVLNRKTSTTSLSSSNVSAVTEVKCAYSACANRVQDPNKKLCEDCHTILTQVKEKRKTRNSSTEQSK